MPIKDILTRNSSVRPCDRDSMLRSSAVLPSLENVHVSRLYQYLRLRNEAYCGIIFFHEVDDTNVVVERDLISLGKLGQGRQVNAACAERP